MRNRTYRRLAVFSLIATLWACSASMPVPTSDEEISLRVMTFNIEWGGTKVSFDNVVEAIRVSRAEIVGIQEAEGNLARLASELGWHYDLRNYVISKYPVIDPGGANGLFVYVEVRPGKIVALANMHLWSDPYGPDEIRDGMPLSQVLELERKTRLKGIETYLPALASMVDGKVPVFVTGDFNAPSHADWTEAAVGSRDHMRYPVSWPVSKAMANAGFMDSWRTVHPDPVKNPGLTWWAGRPPLAAYQPTEKDGQDRIDFVWFAGPVEVAESEIVGEAGGPEVSYAVSPWPSDHRAVVSEFRVAPVDMPPMITTDQRIYRAGDDVALSFRRPGEATIQVVNATTMVPVFRQPAMETQSSWQLPPVLFSPGHYRARLIDNAGRAGSERDFWVLDRDAIPQLQLSGSTFAVGESIGVRWRNGPGNRHDYLAAYERGEAANYDNGLAWAYVNAMPEGSMPLDDGTAVWGWPLPPGEYVMRLMRDDGDDVLAESEPFVVELRVSIAANTPTYADGRSTVAELFATYESLLNQGWQLDYIADSEPAGTSSTLPIIALRSPTPGPAVWILAGIHGEEPAGPNAVAAAIDDIAALGNRMPVVLLPLLNPHGYARNWRYLNVPVYSEAIDGNSVGDSSHLLPDKANPGHARASASSQEADAITRYIMKVSKDYPPRYSIDLHEDNLIDRGYVYSQGTLGAEDPLAHEAVQILRQNNIGIEMSGQTRFGEDIVDGIIGPVTDSSIDELMSSATVIIDGQQQPGPGADTALVFETPARELDLERRVSAHTQLIRRLSQRLRQTGER